MATSEAPLSVPNVMLAVARGAQPSGFIDIDYTLDQVQSVFAVMNTEAAPSDAIWASALAPDQSDADLTQDGSESNPYSVRRAIYSATPGKHVLLKNDGVYTQSHPIQTSSQYIEDTQTQPSPNIIPWNMVEPTSASDRIVIRGEPGTCPAFDFTTSQFEISMDYLEFSHLRINNAAVAFHVGRRSVANDTWIHHVCGEFFRQVGGAENIAFFALRSDAGRGTAGPTIENCFVKGNNSTTNRNNSCMWIDQVTKFTVRNNYFYGVPTHVVYYKSPSNFMSEGGVSAVDATFENNYCEGHVTWAGSYATIRNNIVVGAFSVQSTGGTDAEGNKSNLIERNTIVQGNMPYSNLSLQKKVWDSENNTVFNNVMSSLAIQNGPPDDANLDPATNTNSSDHNLINGPDDNNRFLWDSQYRVPKQNKSLAEWRTYIGLDLNSVVQPNQLKGQGTFTKLADFELIDGSIGLTLSSTGGPVGADISLVGIQ